MKRDREGLNQFRQAQAVQLARKIDSNLPSFPIFLHLLTREGKRGHLTAARSFTS